MFVHINAIILFLISIYHHAYARHPEELMHACETQALMIEQKHNIPQGLLSAITLVESGRSRDHTTRAWPWTVQSQGQSYYFSNKTAAVAAVRRLIYQGVRNIDVGCAQVNLGHHPRAFRDLNEAFDPHANILYAASFLKKLVKKTQSWHEAVAHYHSAHASHHVPYRNKVYRAWERKKKQHPKAHNLLPMLAHSAYKHQGAPSKLKRSISQYLTPVPPLMSQKHAWTLKPEHRRQHARQTLPMKEAAYKSHSMTSKKGL